MLFRMPRRWWGWSGEWWQRAELEADGRLTVETSMDPAERAIILERAAALRSEHVLRDLSFGRQVASIPVEDYYRLLRERPAMNSGDRDERERAWAAFLSSDEARVFLVTDAAAGRF